MVFNQSFFEKYGLKVTDEAIQTHEDKQLSSTIQRLYELTHKNNVSRLTVIELERLVEEHPSVNVLKNYLYLAYLKTNQNEKGYAYLMRTLREAPDYAFAHLNLAAWHIEQKDALKAIDILGQPYDVRHLEKADIIHQSVLISYYSLAVKIELLKGNVGEAKELHKLLFHYDAKNDNVRALSGEIAMQNLKNAQTRMTSAKEKESLVRATPLSGSYLSDAQGQPLFNHSEIKQLYEYSLDDIPQNVVNEILALPRPTLIRDLEHVLADSILRFDQYKGKEWEEETQSFSIHALYLLAALDATESLPIIFEVLSQTYEMREFWYADGFEDFFREPIFMLGRNQLPLLKAFVLKEGVYSWHRSMASSAVAQMILHEPERRSEGIAWFREVITAYLANIENEYLYDSTFLGSMVNYIMDVSGKELTEELKALYDTHTISDFQCGTIDEVLLEINKPIDPSVIVPIPTDIFELYSGDYFDRRAERSKSIENSLEDDYDTFFLSNAFRRPLQEIKSRNPYLKEDDDEPNYYRQPPQETVKREDPKVGRNDPCPCGSGKKYKKCHGQ
jgi:hypothetical protein